VARAIKLCLTYPLKVPTKISTVRCQVNSISELGTVSPTALAMERSKYKSFSYKPGLKRLFLADHGLGFASPDVGRRCRSQYADAPKKTTLSAISNACQEIARQSFVDDGGLVIIQSNGSSRKSRRSRISHQ